LVALALPDQQAEAFTPDADLNSRQ